VIEKFDVMDAQGRPQASVSFDYLPAFVGDAVAELKNFMAQGLTTADGKTQFIKIDNLTLNIFHADSKPTIINTQNQSVEMIEPKEAIKNIKDILSKST
jgi:hypothetical protein